MVICSLDPQAALLIHSGSLKKKRTQYIHEEMKTTVTVITIWDTRGYDVPRDERK